MVVWVLTSGVHDDYGVDKVYASAEQGMADNPGEWRHWPDDDSWTTADGPKQLNKFEVIVTPVSLEDSPEGQSFTSGTGS